MTSVDAGAALAGDAEGLLAQAFDQMRSQRWDEAMRLLESAIVAAPPELRDPAVEILASICVSRNEHARLRELMLRIDPSTPQMIKGALLLARNHAIGIDGELPPHCNEKSLGPALRAHILSGAYQLTELPPMVALLAQLRWAELAGQVALVCTAAGIGIEAGVIERVFAVLSAAGRPADALELLQALQAMPECDERPVQRWMHLLGSRERGSQAKEPPLEDKVVRFLRSTRSPHVLNTGKEPAPC